MKKTGIVRKVDKLGRFVLPKEIRKNLGFYQDCMVEVLVNNQDIVLRKYQQTCVSCGEDDLNNLVEINGKLVCKECIKKLNQKM